MTIIKGTFPEDLCKCMVIYRYVFLRMRNISDRSCRGNQNARLMFCPFSENCAVYEIIWKDMVEPDRPQMT
jgi:hypothetical protein